MQIMKLPYTEVKFYPEVKSQTGLSSLRVSCKRTLIFATLYKVSIIFGKESFINASIKSIKFHKGRLLLEINCSLWIHKRVRVRLHEVQSKLKPV